MIIQDSNKSQLTQTIHNHHEVSGAKTFVFRFYDSALLCNEMWCP